MKKLFLLLVMSFSIVSAMAINISEEAGFIVNTEILSIAYGDSWMEVSRNNTRQFAYLKPNVYKPMLIVRERYSGDKSKRTKYQRYDVIDTYLNNASSYAADANDGGGRGDTNKGIAVIDNKNPDKVRIECYLGANIKVEYIATTATKEQISKFKYEEDTAEVNKELSYDLGLESYSDSPIFTLLILLGKAQYMYDDGISDEEVGSDYNW